MAVIKWGGERVVGSTNFFFAKETGAAALPDGGYVLTLADATGNVQLQRYSTLGVPAGAAIQIASPAGSSEFLPRVTAQANGDYMLAFTESRAAGSLPRLEFRHADGTLFKASSLPAGSSFGGIAAFGTGYLATLNDPANDGDVMVARFASTGLADGFTGIGGFSTFYANEGATAGGQGNPSIAGLPGERFVVSWISGGSDIVLRVFEGDGAPLTGFIVAESAPGLSPQPPAIVALANGGFLLAWSRGAMAGDFDTAGNGVHAQIYSDSGEAVGGELFINATFTREQVYPDMVALPDGGFIAVWSDSSGGQNATDYNIVGQRFDAFGARSGTQFTVNSATDGASGMVHPDIEALADGRLIVSWASTTGHVRSQILDPRDGVVTGAESGDTLYGHDIRADEINGFGGNDTLYGLGNNDQLFGGDGNDTLDGGDGADILDGGAGSDTVSYAGWIGSVSASLVSQSGFNGMRDSFVSIENLIGSASADDFTGDGGANALSGNDGGDRLAGGAGNDTLTGGNGFDTLIGGADNDTFVNPIGDIVTELANQGTDTVESSVAYTLGANVERLFLTGWAVINGNGNELANQINGNTAANILRGYGGADTLNGGAGNDTLDGGAGADTIRLMNANAGIDTVLAFVPSEDRFNLGGGQFTNVAENAGNTTLTHAGGTVIVQGVTGLNIGQWNATVLRAAATPDHIAAPQAAHDIPHVSLFGLHADFLYS